MTTTKPRSIVFLTHKPSKVYGSDGLAHPLTWLPISENVRDERVWKAGPGEYALHPTEPRTYVIAHGPTHRHGPAQR